MLRATAILFAFLQLTASRVAAQSSNSDLVLTFSGGPAMVSSGQYYRATIDIFNWGPDPATNGVVTNILPAGATFIGASASQGTVTQTNGILTWNFGVLPFYRDVTMTFELKPTALGFYTNIASVSSDVPDPVPTNNQVTLVTGVTAARFYASGRTHTGYYMPTVTLLPNNKVLLVGAPLVKTADLYNPATRQCELPGALNGLRSYHTATLMNNGQVLIAGGYYSQNTAEVYDPATTLFHSVGNTTYYHYEHAATLLNDGTVLLCGGVNAGGNDLYNPIAQTFSAASPSLQCAPGGVLLPNGKYLSVSWHDASLYDPSTGITTPTGAPILVRGYFTTTLIPGSGKALVAGGQIFNGATASTDAAELYDIASGTFSLTANMTGPRREHGAGLLPDGTVLLAGGYVNYNDSGDLDRTEIFDINGATGVPGVGVSDASVVEGNSGTNFMNFNVWLTTTSAVPVTVQYGTTTGTASSYAYGVGTPDMVPVAGTLTFPPGTTNIVVPVPILGDTILEPNETIYMNLSLPTQAWISRAIGNGTIIDDDTAPTISVAPAAIYEGDSGLSNLVFNVSLSSPSLTPVTVDYFTTDQTAHSGSDYLQTSGTLTFNPGDTNLMITVPVIGDLAVEPDETLKLSLTNATNAVLVVSNAVGTILNDDGLTGQLHHFDWSVIPDPQTQSIGFPVTITARDINGTATTNIPWPVRLSAFTTNVIATNLDFEQPSLAPWATIDTTPYNRSFSQALFDVAGLGQPSTAARVIAGGGTNGLVQNIYLTGGITYTFSVNVAQSMDAYDNSCFGAGIYLMVGTNYTSWGVGLCGGVARNTLTLTYTAPTNGIYPLQLLIARDYYYGDALAIYLDDVQISYPLITPLVATNFVNGVWSGSITALQGANNAMLLANDGAGHKGTSNPFSIQSAIDLGLSGSSQIIGTPPLRTSMQFAINLSVTNRGPAAAVNAQVQCPLPNNAVFVSATNSQGTISNVAGVIQWTLGSLAKGSNATARVLMQATLPGMATNIFTLTNTALELNPADNSLTVTNLIAPPLISIAPAANVEASAASTGMVFSVTMSGISGQPVSVDYFTSDGSATNGVDYIGTNGTVTFAPGSTNASITVFAIDNILNQPSRTFTLSLTNPVNGVINVTNATGTINDDDLPPVVWIYNTSVVEGDVGTKNATFQLTLSKPAIYNITVNYRTADGTANSTNDYVAQTSSVTFLAGSTNASILVAIKGNTVNEPDETFFVNLTSVNNATFGTNSAVCTILNDDAVPGRFDHFIFDPIVSPQFTGRAFPVTLRAVDYLGTAVPSFTGPAYLTAQSDQYFTNQFSANFEDGLLTGWTNGFTPGVVASNVTDWSAVGQHSMRLTGKAAQSGSSFSLRHAISNGLPTGISFYVRAAQTNALCGRLVVYGSAGYNPFDFYMGRDGRMGINSQIGFSGIPYVSNHWYRVEIQLDWTRHMTSLRVDGAAVATNVPYVINGPYIDTIAVQNTDTATSWFDEINVFSQSYTNLSATPTNLLTFTSGVWTGNITVNATATNTYFTATDNNEHVGRSTNFDVLPIDARLTLPPAVTEGMGTVTGMVTIPVPLSQSCTIYLTSSIPARITVPGPITLAAGQTSTNFVLTVVDDALLNGPQLATISAGATNLTSGATTIEVDDNESANLFLIIPPGAAENAGTLVNTGRLFSSAAPTQNLSVTLTSSDPTSVTVPSPIFLLSGTTSTVFSVTMIDNQKIDGPRPVSITASLANWTPVTNVMIVTDNEDLNLRLSGPAQVSEGFAPVAYTASISGTLATNLVVALSSTDPSRLAVPVSSTILAGQTSTTFFASITDDANFNGSETIAIGTIAPGFNGISTNVLLLDNEVHHFSFAAISSPKTSAVPFSVTVSARDIFDGPVTAYNGTVTLTPLGSGGTIIPASTNITLVSGQWTGNLTLFTAEPVVSLKAADGGGITGQSASFSLVPPSVYLLNINAADLAYSPISQRLWCLVSTNGTLVPTDPLLYQTETNVPVGQGSVQLATSGNGLYVHIANNGTNPVFQAQPNAGVYRFNTLTRTVDMSWTNQGYSVEDLASVPGDSSSVAVSWFQPGYSPYNRGVILYTNGVALTNTGGGNAIEFAESPSTLYGYNFELSSFDFWVMQVDSSGITIRKTVHPINYNANITAAADLIFGSNGGIYDPERGIPIGGTTATPVAGKKAWGRYFQFQPNPGRLTAFDLKTLLPIGATTLAGVSNATGQLIPWGTNGFAFRANSAQVAIARTALSPSGLPADLALSATTSGLPALVGSSFTCTLVISNQGPNNASNVVLAQTLPSNALLSSVVTSTGVWTQSTAGLVCWLSNLTSGATAQVNLTFIGTNASLSLLRSSATADTTDPNLTNNFMSLNISVGRAPAPETVTEIDQITSDIAWNVAANRLFASVPNAQVYLGNSLLALNPSSGVFDAPIATSTEPDKLAVSANGQYVYAGLDADSSVQRVDVSNRVADLKFPTGYGNVNDMAVLPNNPHAVVATVHTTLIVYDDGVQRSNGVGPTEYNQPYFLALTSPTNCYQTYPTGFRRIGIDASGATLLTDTRDTVVTYSDWEIKYGAGRLFTPGGRVFDPVAGTNITTVPYSGLVAPDETDSKVFYLAGSGSVWTLYALDITNLQVNGSVTITNVSGSPTRLIRWGTDGLAFRTTGGQVFIIRTYLADDRNNNGLPDSWEMQNFGSLGAVGGGPNDDPDGDGFSNLQEYRAGMNPHVFDPVRFIGAQMMPGGMQLSIFANPSNSYSLMVSTNLIDWTNVLHFNCTNIPMIITDPGATNPGQRFYRLTP